MTEKLKPVKWDDLNSEDQQVLDAYTATIKCSTSTIEEANEYIGDAKVGVAEVLQKYQAKSILTPFGGSWTRSTITTGGKLDQVKLMMELVKAGVSADVVNRALEASFSPRESRPGAPVFRPSREPEEVQQWLRQ